MSQYPFVMDKTASEPRTDGARPCPEDYSDYRVYLQHMIVWLKANQRGFSYRSFARKAGYSSPSFLKLVAEGKRNLSLSSIAAFGKALGHSRKDQEIFENLVLLCQAQTDADRNRYYARLRKLRGKGQSSRATQMEKAQYDVYSRWYVIPIRELMLQPDFQEDPEWIARRLRPAIRPSEARKALDLLTDVGLAVRDDSGRLRPTTIKLAATGNPVGPLAARNYHRSMLELAAKTLDTVAVEQRNISSLTISLTPEQYEEVCERIAEFRKEIFDLIEDDDAANGDSASALENIYLLGFQLFPLSRHEE